MKNFTQTVKSFIGFSLITVFLLNSGKAWSQHTYQLVYSDNIQGDFGIIGNTLMAQYSVSSGDTTFANAMNSNTTGNGRSMSHIDMDGVAGTRNSSMAKLIVPAGSSVINARIYWGGMAMKSGTGSFDMSLTANRTIKFRKGYGTYTDVVAQTYDVVDWGDYVVYQCSAPVTIGGDPNDAYWAGNIAATTGNYTSGTGAFAGWSLSVVYKNTTLPYKNIRVYDGYQWVYSGGSSTTSTIVLNGLSIPTGVGTDARMGALVWEGDGDLTQDRITINGTTFSDALNPASNPWNGTISTNGAVLPSTSRFPYLANQMSIDIDQINISAYIPTNSSSATIALTTEQDSYYPSVIAFSSNSSAPIITLDKTGTTSVAPFNLLNANELVTYTMTGGNVGGSPLTSCFIVDTIPFGLTYEPGTLVINSNAPGGPTGALTDANDADVAFKATAAGGKNYVKFFVGRDAAFTLLPGDTYSISFKARVPANANPTVSVYNTARIDGISAGVHYFDDGSAIIGPGGITLAVKLTDFKVSKDNNSALLKWTTSGELDNDRFEVERSTDGISFTKAGTVFGNGTTSEVKNYQFADPLVSNANIVYYRLRIVDLDNKATYSKIVALRLNGLATLNNFTVYPNPFTSNVKMQINSTREETITVRINNVAGQQEISRSVKLQPGDNIVVIQDLDVLKPGVHIVEIISEDGKIGQKIMKK